MLSRRCVGCLAILFLATAALAQPPGGPFGGPGGPGGPGGFGGPGGGPPFMDIFGKAMLLRSEQVQTEIKLSSEQQEELQSLAESMREEVGGRMREMFQGMRDLEPEERRERFESMRGEMEEVRDSINSRIDEVLLPEQRERLNQIELQQSIRNRGADAALTGPLAEELGLTEEQKSALQAKVAEVREELQKKIQDLRKEAEEKVLATLTPEQREKLKAMMGTDLEIDPGSMFGPGGRGGRGGFRGRGGFGRPRGPGGQEAGPPAEI